MGKEIAEKIPVKTKWGITAKTLTAAVIANEQVLVETLGMEKYQEMQKKIWGGGSKMSFPKMKEAFNLPVENAIDAANLAWVIATAQMGPEVEGETVEATPERVVVRYTECPWFNRYKELGVKPENMTCPGGHQAWIEGGLNAVNPKITWKLTKAMPRGDPYCEEVYEFAK
jgi:hypothetical protein